MKLKWLRYLDQLGIASSYNTKVYCRQTLIGGNYGLLNTTTLTPNPDYYRQVHIENCKKENRNTFFFSWRSLEVLCYQVWAYLNLFSGFVPKQCTFVASINGKEGSCSFKWCFFSLFTCLCPLFKRQSKFPNLFQLG